jgi:predicted MFS family arabinose efflux permease
MTVRRARRATAVVFAVHGCVTGSFAARVPWIAAHVGVDVGHLGLALLMPGLGALVAMPFSGRLAHRFAFRPLVAATIAAWCASLVLPALPTSLLALCLVLLVFGATAGLADMAMNAQGVLVERRIGRSVMSGLHGCWSAGVLAGSAVSALASHAGVDARAQFTVAALVLAAVAALASRLLLDDPGSAGTAAPPAFALPTREVLLIGLVGLCAVFGEQAGTDWSAVFIRRELDGSASVAALAVSAFALTMATVRLLGDRVIRRLGPVRTIRVSGLCAAAGAVIVVVAPGLAVGLVGFALLGIGVAVVVPLVFAAAGRVGPHPARSVAGVAGVAYGSGLVAPGAIGGIASLSSLTTSFCVVAGLVAAMGLAAGVVRDQGVTRPAPAGAARDPRASGTCRRAAATRPRRRRRRRSRRRTRTSAPCGRAPRSAAGRTRGR